MSIKPIVLLLAFLASTASGAEVASPEEDAIRSALVEHAPSVKLSRTVHELYESEDNKLLWTRDGHATEQANTIVEAMRTADTKGLVPSEYGQWSVKLAQIDSTVGSQIELARFDVTLSEAALHYVSDLGSGRVNSELEHFESDRSPHRQAAVAIVARLANSADVATELADVEPTFPAYKRDEQALQTYIAISQSDSGEKLARLKRTILPGDAYAGVARLSQVLRELGDLPADAVVGAAYEGAIVLAVVHFQSCHGLPTDGAIDQATLNALNVPMARRVVQLSLALERLRWLPREFAAPPLIINIPEFRLHGDDAKMQWVLSMKVVVGKAYRHQTPVFLSDMNEVIFRPDWNVPRDIATKEMIPELEKNPQRLEAQDFDLVDRNGAAHVLSTNDEVLKQLHAGDLRFRQKPGARNALGLVKFVFPNTHDIYLHSTPAPALFQKSRRDFSHGCIRVEEPDVLAAWVLQSDPAWPIESVRAAMNGPKQIPVKLSQPIPVLILYSTAVVMENGDVHFFDDIYGHDRSLERALAQR